VNDLPEATNPMSRARFALFPAALAALAAIAGCADQNLVGGRNYIDQNEYAKAAEVLEKAVAKQPENPEAQFLLGLSYAKTSQFEKAAVSLEEASRLDPAFYALRADTVQEDVYAQLFNAGNSFLNAGQYAEALDRFQKAALFRPDSKDLYQNLGFVHTRLGQRDEAIRAYRRMSEIDPDDTAALRTVLGILSEAGEREQAYGIAREILKSKPNDLQMLKLLADMYYQDADSAKARGDAAEEESKLRQIIPLYESLAQGGNNAAAIYELGLVYYRLNDLDKAALYFEQTTEITESDSPMYRDSLYNLAVALYKTKQFVLAERRVRELIALEPGECEHYRLLNATLQEQKRQNEALDAVKMYEECTKRK
jgi:tetratricopeptide (TPR) repeat protein